jgi:hypothetical protein
MTLLEEYLNFLNESYSTTNTKRSRAQKTKSTAGAIGMSLAKKQNDPLYKRAMMYKKLYMKNKQQLQKKYKSRALMLARQKASKYKR